MEHRRFAIVLFAAAAAAAVGCSTTASDESSYEPVVVEAVTEFNRFFDLNQEMLANPPPEMQTGTVGDVIRVFEAARTELDIERTLRAVADLRDALDNATAAGLTEINGAPLGLLQDYVNHAEAFLAAHVPQGAPFIECVRDAFSGFPDSTPIQDVPELDDAGDCLLAILPDVERATTEVRDLVPIMTSLDEQWGK